MITRDRIKCFWYDYTIMDNSQTYRTYAFVLGREKEIALVELEATLGRLGFCFDKPIVTGNVAVINIENIEADEVAKLSEILGGTIKIFRLINCHSERNEKKPRNPSASSGRRLLSKDPSTSVGMTGGTVGMTSHGLAIAIADIIKREKMGRTGKINFGISQYFGAAKKSEIYTLGLEVKRLLKGAHPARFIESRQEDALSSIVSLKNDLVGKGIEIGLFDTPAATPGVAAGVLVGLSDAEEWSERDYEKPAFDKYSGMMPHKLARAMVNIALAYANPKSEILNPKEIKNSNFENSKIVSDLDIRDLDFHRCAVVDPFCGSGNILMEAAMLWCDVIGSDISEKAVSDTKKNLEWLKEKMLDSRSTNLGFFKEDATSSELINILNSKILPAGRHGKNLDSNMVLVTEPYLGEPKKFMPSQSAAAGEYRKVKDTYINFLKNIKKLDKKIEAVCIVFPLIETTENKRYSLYWESVDEIKSLGYIEERPPLIYGRDYQVVKGEIVFLKYETRNPNIETN